MKRVPILLIAVAIGLVCAAGAQANCGSMSCVNRKLNSLTKSLKKANATIKTDTQRLNGLYDCLGELPLTQYGDSKTNKFGFEYNATGNAGSQPTYRTALDATTSGTKVDVWMLFNFCNTSTKLPSTRAGRIAHATRIPLAPIAREASWPLFTP
jgi:hypothetical protein